MDPLSGFLDGPRARGAFLLRSLLDPPWSLRIADEAALTVVAVVDGAAVVLPDGEPAVALAAGDIAVIRGPEHYTVADDIGAEPQVIIGPGQVCTDLAGNAVADQRSLGVRSWGTSGTAPTVLLTGTYDGDGEVGRRLLAALPRVITVPPGNPMVALLADEIGHDRVGQSAVLDRLLDLVLVTALRGWFERQQPAWYAARADPVVGPALQMLEQDPQRHWTVAELAAEVGSSRAALCRRFADTLGEAPIGYLTSIRMALAADLLTDPDVTVGRVAHRVGYGGPFAFSAAFKRHHGVSPQHFRARPVIGHAISQA